MPVPLISREELTRWSNQDLRVNLSYFGFIGDRANAALIASYIVERKGKSNVHAGSLL